MQSVAAATAPIGCTNGIVLFRPLRTGTPRKSSLPISPPLRHRGSTAPETHPVALKPVKILDNSPEPLYALGHASNTTALRGKEIRMLRMLSKYVGLSLAVLCLATPLGMAQTMT